MGELGTSKSRPLVLILRSQARVEVPGSFVPFEPSDSSWLKKSSSGFLSSVFQRQNFWGGTYFLLAYFAYVISIV